MGLESADGSALWEDGIMIYKHAYAVLGGGHTPVLPGSNVREGPSEVVHSSDNVMKVGQLSLTRSGAPERVWMNGDYSPAFDLSARSSGVRAVVVEPSERVLSERHPRPPARKCRQFEQAPHFALFRLGQNI